MGAVVLTLVCAGPAAAAAAGVSSISPGAAPRDPNALTSPATLDRPPAGHVRSGDQVLAIARGTAKVRRIEQAPGRRATITNAVFLKGTDRWQVSFYDKARREVAQVLINDRTGVATEVWDGPQVAWTMARGYPGAFGRKVNAPYVWIALLVAFVIPFVDWRRPFRARHGDLLAIAGLSVSLAYFNGANIEASVPLSYPPLLWLLGRMLWVGLRRGDEAKAVDPLRLLVPASWLAIGIIFLLGFRVGLNVTDSNVIDVGYSGVIGADRLVHGERIYENFPKDDPAGDTYGPVAYAAYVPFELAMPWKGRWDDLPAAHGAAILFDLLACGLLFLLGRRVRGPTVGIALAYAWAACPWTLYALSTNSNDSLVAATLLLALLVAARPMARGAAIAVAGLTKFAPLALAPLFFMHGVRKPDAGEARRSLWRSTLGFTVAVAICLAPVWLHGELREFYDRTIGYQASRPAPFSIWGMHPELEWLRSIVRAGGIVLAVGVAFIPRRRDLVGLAALSAAIIIALQLGLTYWFYLYIVWVLPAVFIASIAIDGEPEAVGVRDPARAPNPAPLTAATASPS